MKGFKMRALVAVAAFLGVMAFAHAGDGWLTDFKKAQKLAKKEKKLILADFSGSDWCGWCIKLDNEVFSKSEFKKFAKEHFILFLADFPRKKKQSSSLKKQNQKLMQKYGVRGFPTVLILDADGKVVAQTGYQRGGPKNYIKYLEDNVLKKK
jgi:thioredoxin-related protein